MFHIFKQSCYLWRDSHALQCATNHPHAGCCGWHKQWDCRNLECNDHVFFFLFVCFFFLGAKLYWELLKKSTPKAFSFSILSPHVIHPSNWKPHYRETQDIRSRSRRNLIYTKLVVGFAASRCCCWTMWMDHLPRAKQWIDPLILVSHEVIKYIQNLN